MAGRRRQQRWLRVSVFREWSGTKDLGLPFVDCTSRDLALRDGSDGRDGRDGRYVETLREGASVAPMFYSAPLLRDSGAIARYLLLWLDLSDCGITDESIPEDLGGLSSLITLHLGGNDFANLPTGCFSNLFQLLHLYLSDCGRLKSLPKLPPRLIHLEASVCDSMEPLSSDGMWNLVSSLDHEYRLRTNYEKRMLQPIQLGFVPEADFLALMPKFEIPSWFPNKATSNESDTLECELVVDVPPYFRASKWCGLAVCLEIKGRSSYDEIVISWSCKAAEDYYICKEWANRISLRYGWERRLCLMLLDFNEKTCWQHLRGDNHCLHIKLSVRYEYSNRSVLKLECGWRALCEEEMQEWGNTTIDFNNLTEPERNSCADLPTSEQGSFHGGGRNVSSNHESSRRQNQGRRNPLLACWPLC